MTSPAIAESDEDRMIAEIEDFIAIFDAASKREGYKTDQPFGMVTVNLYPKTWAKAARLLSLLRGQRKVVEAAKQWKIERDIAFKRRLDEPFMSDGMKVVTSQPVGKALDRLDEAIRALALSEPNPTDKAKE